MTLLFDMFILPPYILLGSRIWKSAIYFITHITFNYIIFKDVAPIFLKIM